ncbi:hypothetical protein LPTSP3_g09010 [Leptospira kobayashii]|uniref:NHL repeat protein n=1 Tax=Leptospira kobayashii TaxID=1917830 RepID=A0ABN6KCP6_9LEPT|nr:hypothetical protein LPTSP3_g09010 [Leptospira kobayashii]
MGSLFLKGILGDSSPYCGVQYGSGAPTQVKVVGGLNKTTISWQNVPGASSYKIYWKTSAGVTRSDSSIGNASSPYVHSDLAGGLSVYYRVVSVGAALEGALSEEVNTVTGASFSNFQNADIVIGQPDFVTKINSPVTAANLNYPGPITVSGNKLYISDSRNHRILGYHQIPTTNGAPADFVIGQPDFVSSGLANPPTATSFSSPWSIASSNERLFVADTSNNRQLIYNSLPTANVNADVVLGVSNFTTAGNGTCSSTDLSSSEGVSTANGKLFVADEGNHRVLIWNTIPTSHYTPADVVIGQPDFTSCTANRGGPTPTANTLATPGGVWGDGTRLFVADSYNGRLLIWNTIPTTNGQPADLVLGQSSMESAVSAATGGGFSLGGVYNIFSNGTQLVVGDGNNNRVLIWDSFPTVNGQSADKVLGQSNFTNNVGNDDSQTGVSGANPTARTLANPYGVYMVGNQLFVDDYDNHRILIFKGK